MSSSPRPGYICAHCQEQGDHFSWTCFQRPQKPMKQESDKALEKRRATRKTWFSTNKSDSVMASGIATSRSPQIALSG